MCKLFNDANEVVEKALAHVVPNATEAAYRRGDMLERRRPLMDEWEREIAIDMWGFINATRAVLDDRTRVVSS